VHTAGCRRACRLVRLGVRSVSFASDSTLLGTDCRINDIAMFRRSCAVLWVNSFVLLYLLPTVLNAGTK
jgi:hypothetical protein